MRIDSGREDTALYAAGSGQIKIARWNLDSGLEIKLDPCWRVVGPFRWPAKGRKNSADELEDLAEPVPRAQGFVAGKLAEICTFSLHSSYTAKNVNIICN